MEGDKKTMDDALDDLEEDFMKPAEKKVAAKPAEKPGSSWDQPGQLVSAKDLEEDAKEFGSGRMSKSASRKGISPPKAQDQDDPDAMFADVLKSDKESKKELDQGAKQKRNQLFFGGSKPATPEVNPYLNVRLAESDSGRVPESGRVKTPMVPSARPDAPEVPKPKTQEEFMPPVLFPGESKNVFTVDTGQAFIPGASRRQKTRMLAKPGTASDVDKSPIVPLVPEMRRPPADPSITPPEPKSRPAEVPEGTKQQKHGSEDDGFDIDDDLPLESKEEKKGKEAKGEDEDYLGNSAYRPTISDNQRSRSRSPIVRDSSKELPASRRSSRTPDREHKESDNSSRAGRSDRPATANVKPQPEPEIPPVVTKMVDKDLQSSVAPSKSAAAAKDAGTEKSSTHEAAEFNRRIQDLLATLDKVETENSQLKAENAALKNERESSKVFESRQTQDVQKQFDEKYRKEIDALRGSHEEEIKRLEDAHTKALKAVEQDRDRAIELERKVAGREKARLEQMHKLDMENVEKVHKQSLETVKRQVEFDSESTKNQLQRETELSKLTSQVDGLMVTMRAKLEEEMRDKVRAIEEREAALEDAKRKLDTERTKIEVEKKRVEDQDKHFRDMEKQLLQEADEHKRLYEYQREVLENQHNQWLKEESEKREMLMMEKRQLDVDKARWEKERRDGESQRNEENLSFASQRKVFEKQKEDLDSMVAEHNE